MQVKVQQDSGTIGITGNGPNDDGTTKTYNVKDGHVTVAADDVPAFLAAVDGSSVSNADAAKLDA